MKNDYRGWKSSLNSFSLPSFNVILQKRSDNEVDLKKKRHALLSCQYIFSLLSIVSFFLCLKLFCFLFRIHCLPPLLCWASFFIEKSSVRFGSWILIWIRVCPLISSSSRVSFFLFLVFQKLWVLVRVMAVLSCFSRLTFTWCSCLIHFLKPSGPDLFCCRLSF